MASASDMLSFRLRIESLRNSVVGELKNYPPPIPACDAHYNHLLELRQLLGQELTRLDSAADQDACSIEDFIGKSPCKETLSKLARGD